MISSLNETAIEVLVSAFRADPAARWMYPDALQYEIYFPKFAQAFGGAAFAHETDLQVDDAVALWLPPGVEPSEEELVQLIEKSMPAEKAGNVFALLECMGKYHPSTAHWYLPMIGVAPERQGRGLGEGLMREALARCDAAGMPAYLESTNPRNIPFYERLGFRAIGEIRVADCPVLTPMWRDAE